MTATHLTYFHLCHRKLWLFHNGIHMEHNSDLVYEGKLIGEGSYAERADKNRELALELPDGQGSIKIDFFDAATRTVHETKKSDKMEQVHVAQVKFYLWALEVNGIAGAQGIIEYPRLRTRQSVQLEEQDRRDIPRWIKEVEQITSATHCPTLVRKPICKACSYFEYCFAGEEPSV